MLVLSRKVGERLCIANDITLVIKSIKAGRVSVGIEAPSFVKVMRGELQPLDPAVVRAK